MYNRYHGNSGRVERVEDSQMYHRTVNLPPDRPLGTHTAPKERNPPGPLSGLSGSVGKLLRRLSSGGLETEDFLLIVLLYLLYRDSGDEEFLFAIGCLLLL